MGACIYAGDRCNSERCPFHNPFGYWWSRNGEFPVDVTDSELDWSKVDESQSLLLGMCAAMWTAGGGR